MCSDINQQKRAADISLNLIRLKQFLQFNLRLINTNYSTASQERASAYSK